MMKRPATFEYNLALVRWIRNLYGPGTPFRSGIQLSLAANRSRTTISSLEKDGRATSSVIIDLAKAAGAPALDGLIIAGFLTESDRGVDANELGEIPRKILEGVVRLPEPAQTLVLGAVQGLLNTGADQGERSSEAEDQGSLRAQSNG